jgi:hypothetical protein
MHLTFFIFTFLGSSMSRQTHPSSTTSATTSDPSSLLEMKGLDNPALSIDTSEIDSGI